MSDKNLQVTKKLSRLKVYVIALVVFIIINFLIETCITLIENETRQWLYPIFPYTRIGLLIITVLVANYYIRRRMGSPKPKLWLRAIRAVLIVLVSYGLVMGAWFSVSNADLERAQSDFTNTQEEYERRINNLPAVQSPTLVVPDSSID